MGNEHEINMKVKYLHQVAKDNPINYSTERSAGIDLRACIDHDFQDIAPGERYAFPTGIAIEICTDGVAGFIYSRSGLGTKDGLTVSQGVGVIDPDYRGQIIVSLLNTSGEKRRVERGQRIAQLVLMPYCHARITPVEDLSDTSRGCGGFGHTGRK